MKKNIIKKVIICTSLFATLLFSSCKDLLGGEDFLLELEYELKKANSNGAIVTIECDAEKKKQIVPPVGPLAGGKKEGTVIDLEFEESKDYIFEKWIAIPEGSVNFENETERKTKATIVSSKEDITIEPVCIKKYVLTVDFLGEHGSTNPYEQKKYFPTQSFMLSYRSESDYGFTKWEILDSKTKKVLENPPVKIIGTGTEVNVEVLAMESDMEITVKAAAVRRPSIISYSPDWSENGEDSTQTITAMFSQKMNPVDISKYITIVNRATQENLKDNFSEPYFDTALTTLRMNAKKEKLLPDGTEIVVTLDSEICDENKIKLGTDFTWTYKVNGKRDETPGSFNALKMYAAVNGAGKYVANKEILFDKAESDFNDASNLKTYNLVEKKIILTGSVVDEGSGPDFVNWKLSKIYNTFYPTDYLRSEVDIVSKQEVASEFLNFAGQVAYFQNNGVNPTIDLSNDIKESGVYKLSLTVTDKSGNVSEPNDFFFNYDVSAPEITGLFENRFSDTQTNILGTLDKCKDFDKVVISICGYETGGTGIDDTQEDIVVTDNRGDINRYIYNIKPNYSYEFNFVSYDKAGNSKTFKIERDTTPLPHIDVNDITVKTFAKDVVKVTFPPKTEEFSDYWKTEITVKDGKDFQYLVGKNNLDVNKVTTQDFRINRYLVEEKESAAFRKIESWGSNFTNFSTKSIKLNRNNEDFEIIKDLNYKRVNTTLLITEYDFAGNKTETEYNLKSEFDVGMYYYMDGYWAYDANHGKDKTKYSDSPIGVLVNVGMESDSNTGTIISYRIKGTNPKFVFPESPQIAYFGEYDSNLDEQNKLHDSLITNKIAVTDKRYLTSSDPNLLSIDGYFNTYMILDNGFDSYFIINPEYTMVYETFWDVILEENINVMNSLPELKWYLPSVYEALDITKNESLKSIIKTVIIKFVACSSFYYDGETFKALTVYNDGTCFDDIKPAQTQFFAKVNPDW